MLLNHPLLISSKGLAKAVTAASRTVVHHKGAPIISNE